MYVYTYINTIHMCMLLLVDVCVAVCEKLHTDVCVCASRYVCLFFGAVCAYACLYVYVNVRMYNVVYMKYCVCFCIITVHTYVCLFIIHNFHMYVRLYTHCMYVYSCACVSSYTVCGHKHNIFFFLVQCMHNYTTSTITFYSCSLRYVIYVHVHTYCSWRHY